MRKYVYDPYLDEYVPVEKRGPETPWGTAFFWALVLIFWLMMLINGCQ